MSTITREQLRERARAKVKSLEFAVTQTAFADSRAELEEELELARIALASLEAVPSYFVNRVKHSDAYGEDLELRTYCYELDAMKSKDDFGGEIVPVYTVPPAPFALPVQHWEELCRQNPDMSIGDAIIRAAWWNHCAAMLQGAEPVTTDYKLPANTPCKDAPEHIWLQTAGVWPENGEFSELTWCSDNQHKDDTLYVRADVVSGNSPAIPDGLRLALSNAGIAAPESDEMLAATSEKYIQELVTWVKDRKPFRSAVIPDGWVLVPVEPTAELLQSGISAHYERSQIQIHERPAPGPMECAYVAMLAAAPQPEVK
ncbi:hypothetical protein ABKV24_04525 [Enterobacter mori]|uniref:hypothetical protein n=1 Tax=Enterobacter mori TaxID=539813 RepID=UPI0032AF94D6